MKIVIDARESGTSTGRYIDKLIEYLHQLEPTFEITILSKPSRTKFIKSIAPTFDVLESNFKEFTLAEQTGLLKQLNSLDADLVHFGMTQQPIWYKGKTVTTIHDLTTARFTNPAKNWFVFKVKQLIYKYVIKRVARKSDKVITPSQFVKDDVAQFAHIAPEKIEVTYEAADKITAKPEPVKELIGKQYIMYVGRAQPHKNLQRLVDAFIGLRTGHPDLRLVLAGKIDGGYRQLQKYVEKRSKDLARTNPATGLVLASSVLFTGYVSDGQLRWLYENTAAYVFPSLSEGFGLPALEAMVHGAPVVSSNATCLPEIYGEAAIYFDPKDIDDIANKITSLLEDSQLTDRLRKNGQNQAAKYSWQVCAEETLKVYKDVLNQH